MIVCVLMLTSLMAIEFMLVALMAFAFMLMSLMAFAFMLELPSPDGFCIHA